MFDPTSEERALHDIQNIGLGFIGFYNILFKAHDILSGGFLLFRMKAKKGVRAVVCV